MAHSNSLDLMFDALEHGDPVYRPSEFWRQLNEQNIRQLNESGLENLKRSVAQNYFTWVVPGHDEQYQALRKLTPWYRLPLIRAPYSPPCDGMPSELERALVKFTRMLWLFAERNDREGLLKTLREPEFGNPFDIKMRGRLISQDLANSLLEYYAIRETFNAPRDSSPTILELGAGYGRCAWVWLHAYPNARYIIVDIPPALHVAQEYLTTVLPDVPAFRFRPFDTYDSVANEMESAQLVFLLPHQAAMLPDKSVDLFINISSLHEMTFEQIHVYYRLIDRLTRGYFYTKQWILQQYRVDGVVVRREDYPTPSHWTEEYSRTHPVQVKFFEAMYQV